MTSTQKKARKLFFVGLGICTVSVILVYVNVQEQRVVGVLFCVTCFGVALYCALVNWRMWHYKRP
jgi:hypothetical protein